ncbi:MAG TPA: hypothetical protein PLU88_00470 [Armatimonadota bacterium]|nr:hypothetical protein [Armatimonadota bacterium]HOM71316.1 hypothetical protein [Armatimonadota bacterium]HOP80961.1 hypothetical protein [Armatimonadota bacterium]HPP73587.1 hypothetical protein [Armatimonadota bacterium]
MSVSTRAGIMMFSREMRRRVSQAQREGRGFQTPGPGRPRACGTCCLVILILLTVVVIYAFVEGFFRSPQERRDESSCSPVKAVVLVDNCGCCELPHYSNANHCNQVSGSLT